MHVIGAHAGRQRGQVQPPQLRLRRLRIHDKCSGALPSTQKKINARSIRRRDGVIVKR
jgi:hypothetical protein